MSEQLSLDVEVATGARQTGPQVDLVDSVIEACGGDARTAVKELLADADFLRDQFYTASSLMCKGIGRGWKPKYERI